jgi:hypothetical protein
VDEDNNMVDEDNNMVDQDYIMIDYEDNDWGEKTEDRSPGSSQVWKSSTTTYSAFQTAVG